MVGGYTCNAQHAGQQIQQIRLPQRSRTGGAAAAHWQHSTARSSSQATAEKGGGAREGGDAPVSMRPRRRHCRST